MSHAISHVMPVTFPMLSVECDALHIVERGERERLAVSHNETGKKERQRKKESGHNFPPVLGMRCSSNSHKAN